MAVNLSPVGGVAAQFFTSTGAVLTGGKLYTYAAGTTTPATAYTSSDGSTAWTNPIVLNAAGRVSGGGEIWITDGVLYKFVLTDANDVLIATYDNISGINSNFISFTNSQQIITATAGQTVFNLSINYQVGTNSLSVFVDGVNQYGPGAQYAYTETDSDTVTFVSGLHVGAQVKFTTTQQQGAGVTNASQVTYNPAGTGAVATNVQAKLRQTISVADFGAVGNGTTDDTVAFQTAATAASGKDIEVPAGTYKITGNTNVAGNFVCSGDVDIPVVGSTTVATNVRSGLLALSKVSTGKYNTAVGRWAMVNNTTGEQNSAYGVDALYTNTSGFGNVALGSHAMVYNTTGSNNVGIGIQTLEGDPAGGTGSFNTAVGAQALSNFTSAGLNVAMGANAGLGITTGSNNVFVGSNSGITDTPANKSITGNVNTYVGYGTGPAVAGGTISNSTAIGNGALVDRNNSAFIGNSSVTYAQLGSVFQADATGIRFSSAAPASATAVGIAGTVTWDSSYIYVCVATNTWKRVAIATW
jgi:hypothetical protein